jgi:hypothetical protein
MADKNGVELEVIEQLHLSSVRADTMGAGQRFTVSESTAQDLIKRGLAKRPGGTRKAAMPNNKKAAAPSNKRR